MSALRPLDLVFIAGVLSSLAQAHAAHLRVVPRLLLSLPYEINSCYFIRVALQFCCVLHSQFL